MLRRVGGRVGQGWLELVGSGVEKFTREKVTLKKHNLGRIEREGIGKSAGRPPQGTKKTISPLKNEKRGRQKPPKREKSLHIKR